jgi:aminoglycoside phosphotransferase (APT) family kinase protein
MEHEVFVEESNICSRIPQLLEFTRSSGPAREAAVKNLRHIVDTQREFLAAQDPDILKGSYVCYQGGRIDEERLPARPHALGKELTEATLTQHLQGRFPGCRVEKLSVMAGGFSKTTVFFTLIQANGQSESFVIRKDLPVEFNSSVAYEFPLLQKLHQAGFAVAEPVWLEDDPAPFGGRFLVSRRVGGSTDFSRWASDKASVDNFARQLAKTMADLHAMNLGKLGYAPELTSKSAGELTRIEIERWRKVFEASRVEVQPLIELSFAWLEANIPIGAFSRRASLIHGDIGFHNMMIDDGKVSALLDWEFSHLGDPIEELLYTKPFIEKVMDWETFKSYYRDYGGTTCTAEDEFFYTVWSKTRSPADCALSQEIFADVLPNELKYAVSGTILGRYLELEAARMIVESL